jgi:hypothetical protein
MWFRRSNRGADTRLKQALPLVAAVEAGLFAFLRVSKWTRQGGRSTACVVVPRPSLRTAQVPRQNSSQTQLHCWDAPAVRWPGGPEYWYWQGIRISRELIDRPSRLTASYIVRQRNVERRRVLLERLGYEQFLASAGAKLFQQDDYGKLWNTELRLDGEPVTVVEVTNSTPEPDGSYRRYWLRVPPGIRSARRAVALTFGYDRASDYTVVTQT